MSFFVRLLLWAVVLGAVWPLPVVGQSVTIGFVLDGLWTRNAEVLSTMQSEIAALVQSDFRVSFPKDKQLVADWGVSGVRSAFDALLCSWILSLTMIPMLSVRFMKVHSVPESASVQSKWYGLYHNALIGALQHPVWALIVTIAIFVGTMGLWGFVPSIFLPEKDEPIITAEFELPVGSPVERTEAVAEKIDAFIAEALTANEDRPEGVVNWATFIIDGWEGA